MYKIYTSPVGTTFVIRVADSCFIPFGVTDNQDYQEYQAWLAEGNTPLPADPIV